MRHLRARSLATILAVPLALAAMTASAMAQNYGGPPVRNYAGPALPPPPGSIHPPLRRVGPPGLVWIPAHTRWDGYRNVLVGGHWGRLGYEREHFVPGR